MVGPSALVGLGSTGPTHWCGGLVPTLVALQWSGAIQFSPKYAVGRTGRAGGWFWAWISLSFLVVCSMFWGCWSLGLWCIYAPEGLCFSGTSPQVTADSGSAVDHVLMRPGKPLPGCSSKTWVHTGANQVPLGVVTLSLNFNYTLDTHSKDLGG